MEFYSYTQLLHTVLYKSPEALQQALTLDGIHSLSSNENRVSAPKEILLCDRSIFIPKIGFIFVSLPPGPKIKYRVSHFDEGFWFLTVGEILTKKKSLFSVNSVLHYLGSSCCAQNLRNFGCFSQCWPKNVTHSQKFSSDLAPHKSSICWFKSPFDSDRNLQNV